MERLDQLRPAHDEPVPPGISGTYQRLLQIYRAYRAASPNNTKSGDQQGDWPGMANAIDRS
jgi:hypothetical protein